MVMPALSVTAIGLFASLFFIIVDRSHLARTLLIGVVGAWAGFIVGAIIGAVIDTLFQTGSFIAIIWSSRSDHRHNHRPHTLPRFKI